MPIAEIITIGTELLLGEIVDTNSKFIARALRDIGVDLYRTMTIGDNPQRIASAIQDGLSRADIVITTGGLGPTIDDPTREAVALAFGRSVEFKPELWDQIQARFERYNRKPTDNNKRQAYIPQGSIIIENPVGTAPSFAVEENGKVVISLPGVPREMEHLMQNYVISYLIKKYSITSLLKIRTIHTAGLGESQIDDWIGDLETLSNPTVGLSAHSGQVDIRISAKAHSDAEAEALIQPVETMIKKRLGDAVYGVDQDTLENSALDNLKARGWSLCVYESGLSGELVSRLAPYGIPFLGGEILAFPPEPDQRLPFTAQFCKNKGADVALGILSIPGGDRQEIFLAIVSPLGSDEIYRPYGGPPGNAPRFAVNNGLNLLRSL